MKAEEIDAVLRPFCADENHGRFRLTEPFCEGGYRVGTDSKVLLRTKADPAMFPPPPEGAKFPPVWTLFKEGVGETSMLEFADVKQIPPAPEACKSCGGKGLLPKCEDCGVEHDCPCCDGNGFAGGSFVEPEKVWLLGQVYDVRILHKIAGLPGLRFAHVETKMGPSLFFRSGEFEGLAMPLTASVHKENSEAKVMDVRECVCAK